VQRPLFTSDQNQNVPQGLKPSTGQTHGTAKAAPFVQRPLMLIASLADKLLPNPTGHGLKSGADDRD
jgi:hypothetical protein